MVIDRLFQEVKEKGNVCLGLDTAPAYIPIDFLKGFSSEAEAVFNFNKKIIDATYDVVGCYKVQIAYYEALGLEGLAAYKNTLIYIREKKSLIIADIKRGDIADTAKMYAKAHFTGDFESDFITLNPYMGMDSIDPYLPYLDNEEKGLFILMRTSNKGAEDIEYIQDKNGLHVYDIVGEKIQSIGSKFIGKNKYSSLGAVVGCTHQEEAVQIREKLSNTFFLIPGYGAQGGGGKEVALYLKNGNGGVVNSSRGILLAYKKVIQGEKKFDVCAREEVLRMRKDIFDACSI